MDGDQQNPDAKSKAKAGKIQSQQAGSILLTPGSSRRKNAWKKLKTGGDRGLTQDKITRYLDEQIKNMYQRVRKEGALTFDKVQRYLDYLAKLSASSLAKPDMNQEQIGKYVNRIKPVIEDVGTKSAITENDVAEHTQKIRQHAADHLEELKQLEARPDVVDKQEASQELREPALTKEISEEFKAFLGKSLVPIGFEEGVPRITVEDFLQFPLSACKDGVEDNNPFAMHLRYLDLAVSKSCFQKEHLDLIRQHLTTIPVKGYSKYIDIFPYDEYEDAKMTIVFCQWQNGTLDRYLPDNNKSSG